MIRISLVLSALFCFNCLLYAQNQQFAAAAQNYNENMTISGGRQIFLLNETWQYLEKNSQLADLADSGQWQHINLPHTWNKYDATDNEPGYRRSAKLVS